MIDYRKVLLGFDFSRGAHAAAQAAIALAREAEGDLDVVIVLTHGIDPSLREELRAEGVKDDEIEMAARVRIADDALAALSDYELTGIDTVSYHVVEGSVDSALLTTASELDAELIVVGAVGKDTEDSPARVGTDTFRLVRRSPIPVLVIKRDSPFPPEMVLTAIDGSGASGHALAEALKIAEDFGSEVTALHIREGRSDGMEAFAALEAFGSTREDVQKRIKEGVPYRVLNAAGRDHDLLAVGSIGRSAIVEMLLGGTAERVLRELPCSMLFVKEQ